MSDVPRYALVTGAGSGIGRASALALLADGWHVALAGRRADALAETVEMAADAAARALPIAADVASADGVIDLFRAYSARWSRLDLLFNNAGTNVPAVPLEDLSCEQWQAVVDVNLTGTFLCTQQAFRIMKAQEPMGGRIINNGSISAHAPRPLSIAYTATKHAVTGLTRSTSLDGRPYNIACGQIDIGNAGTQMTRRMHEGVRQANDTVMAEPVMDVEHVGDTIVHMASLPLDTNVQFLTIMATRMPFVGRG